MNRSDVCPAPCNAALPPRAGVALLIGAWATVIAAGLVGSGGPATDAGLRWAVLTLALAPWVEEVLFRAGLQVQLRRRCSAAAAIGLTALAFGAAHALVALAVAHAPGATSLLLAAGTALPALGIGWLYEKTGRLLPCIVAHAALNLMAWGAISSSAPLAGL